MKLEEAIVYLLVTQLAHDPVIEDGHLLIEEALGGVGDFGQLDEVTPCQLMRQCRDYLCVGKCPRDLNHTKDPSPGIAFTKLFGQ